MNQSVISQLQGGKYLVDSLIGAGGFGNTYLATQVALGRKVAIKEFYMKEFCERDCSTSHVIIPTEATRKIFDRYKMKFLKEAQMIASLKNQHIIQIYDIFEENDTAYYVMDYVEGGSLKDKVEKEGPMTESSALAYVRQIADALSHLHQHNILHLDVKPANILTDHEDNVILIDFGISKHYDSEGGQTSTTPAGVSKGYAPIEQYQQGSISGFTPSTDIYSLGATLYFLLTGETPPEASIIYEDGLPSSVNAFSQSVQNVVTTSMSPRRKDRFQTMEEFVSALPTGTDVRHVAGNSESKAVADEETVIIQSSDAKISDETDLVPVDEKSNSKGSRKLVMAIIIALLAVLGGVLLFRTEKSETVDYSMSKIMFDDGRNHKTLVFGPSGNERNTLKITKNFTENVTFVNVPDWITISYSDNSVNVKSAENRGSVREVTVYLHRNGDGGKYAAAQIKIRQEAMAKNTYPAPVISHDRVVLKSGGTLQLSVKNARGQISWSTSNTNVASVSANGFVTAKQKGTATVTANADGKRLTCHIEVQQSTDTYAKPTNNNTSYSDKPVEISRNSATIPQGGTLKLELYNAKSDFEWESSNPSVATVNKYGVVTARSEGKAVIWAKYTGNFKKCEVTVTSSGTRATQSSAGNTTGKIELSRSSATLKRGNTLKLYLYNATSDFEWESSNSSVATVSNDGVVTAKSPGKVTIWAKHPGEFRKCEITVTSY